MATDSKKPTHTAYVVRDGKEKGFWREIGVGFAHKDGKGFDVLLDALPVDGRVVIRVNESKAKAD